MTREISVALIGCGDISVVHRAAIEAWPHATLVGVCDIDAGRLNAARASTGAVGYADYVQLMDEMKPDVVHIATPHATHVDIAVAALERGVNVVLEKPVAHSRDAARRVIAAAHGSRARIAVCFQNRYNATSQRAREILASGELGRVISGAATVMWNRPPGYYRDRPWRGSWEQAGGGLLMNQAIHTLDLLQWFVGEVVAVSGTASTHVLSDVSEVEDTAEMVLTHAEGQRSIFYATLAHSRNAPITIDIQAERGTLHLEGDLVIRRDSGETEIVSDQSAGVGERSYWGTSHALLIHDFYRTLETTEPFWIDADEANASLSIIQELYDQAYPERPVVTPVTEWSAIS